MSKKSEHFWTWFLQHKNELKNLNNLPSEQQKHFTFWLDWHLQFYFPGLEYIMVIPKTKNKKTEFTLLAKGTKELFSVAIELEKTAPILWDWKFTALIQPRKDIDNTITATNEPSIFPDIILKSSKLKFISFEYDSEKKVELIVHLKNATIYLQSISLPTLINIILRGLLDEKTTHEISFVQLAQVGNDKEQICLYELEFYLDEINNSGNNQ
jgi:hypothetical protein